MLKATKAICQGGHPRKAAIGIRNARFFESSGVRFFSDAEIKLDHGKGEWKAFGVVKNYNPGKFCIETFNKISTVGLNRFDENRYDIVSENKEKVNSHAILLRSHKLKEEEVKQTVRAIAR